MRFDECNPFPPADRAFYCYVFHTIRDGTTCSPLINAILGFVGINSDGIYASAYRVVRHYFILLFKLSLVSRALAAACIIEDISNRCVLRATAIAHLITLLLCLLCCLLGEFLCLLRLLLGFPPCRCRCCPYKTNITKSHLLWCI